MTISEIVENISINLKHGQGISYALSEKLKSARKREQLFP